LRESVKSRKFNELTMFSANLEKTGITHLSVRTPEFRQNIVLERLVSGCDTSLCLNIFYIRI
jgi:hypothetical protein